MKRIIQLTLFFIAIFSITAKANCDFKANFTGGTCYLTCGSSAALNPAGALTVEAWIFSQDSVNNQKIAGNIDPFSYSGYLLGMDMGMLYCEVIDDNGVYYNFKTGRIPYGVWTHVAFTYNKGDAMRGYINGVEIYNATAGSATIRTSPMDFVIGAAPWDQIYFNYHGDIDEVRVYGIARTAAQIRQDMRIDVSALSPISLIGYWRFLEGTGSTVADLSGNGNSAVFNGTVLPTWVAADGPYGIGSAASSIVSCCATTSFSGQNFSMTPSLLSIPEVFVSTYINCDPGGPQPVGSPSFNYGYWVLDRYVVAPNYQTDLTFKIDPLSISVTDVAADFELYYRPANSNGTWASVAMGSSLNSTTGEVTFSALPLAGQFMVGANGNTLLSVASTKVAPFSVYPNPATASLHVTTASFSNHDVLISDLSGRVVSTMSFFGSNASVDIQSLSSGFYLISLDNAAPKQIIIK